MQRCDLGLIGLGVMGENLALNFARHGFSVCGFDLDAAKRAPRGKGQLMAGIRYVRGRSDIIVILAVLFVLKYAFV